MRLPRRPPGEKERVRRTAGVLMLGFALSQLLDALAQLLEALQWWSWT